MTDTITEVATERPMEEQVLAEIEGSEVQRLNWANSLGTMQRLRDQVLANERLLTQQREVQRDWLDRLQTRAGEVARDEDWCGVYDRTCLALGLTPRRAEREYSGGDGVRGR